MKDILYPLIYLLQTVYLSLNKVVGSYGVSLLLLSLVTSVVMAWLGRLIKRYPEREKLVQSLMAPKMEAIKQEKDPQVRHQKTMELYKRYHYHPLLALRSAFPLFLQLPFLFAAYHMLSSLELLKGQQFWIISDLSSPDRLLWKINLLPFVMTAVNIWTALITPGFSARDKIQASVIAGLFLLLLYNAPSALLIYWTMNNLFFLVRTWVERKNSIVVKAENPLHVSPAIIEEVLSAAKLYFGFLVVYYFLLIAALEDGYVFKSFVTYIPFLGAAIAFWLLQTIDLYRSSMPKLRRIIAWAVLGFSIAILVAGLFASITILKNAQLNLETLLHFAAIVFSISAFTIGFILPRNKAGVTTDRFSGLLLVIILALIPATHFAKVNSEYLSGPFYLVFFAFICLIAIINYLLSKFSFSHNASHATTYKAAAIFTLLFFSLPLLRSFMRVTGKPVVIFWVLFAILFSLSFLIRSPKSLKALKHISVIVLLVFSVSFCYSLIFKVYQKPQGKTLSADLANIKFKEHPNVYLFCYDGIPNERVFKELGLPFDRLSHLLSEYGFKLYQDTYSLGNFSLQSVSKMLDFTDRFISDSEGRDIYAGNSYTNLVMRNNGYSTHLLLGNYYVGTRAFERADLYDELFPHRSIDVSRLDNYLDLMRSILKGEMGFDSEGLETEVEADIQKRKIEIIKEQHPKAFILNHFFCPGHSSLSGKWSPEEEQELWKKRLTTALDQMEKDFATLKKYDPNAIVIAFGDHGPYLTGDCFLLADWAKEEITPELLWDRLGTMVAIRWPDKDKAAKYDMELVTNQDVFPIIFAYLCDDSSLLKYCPDDVFWGLKLLTPYRSEIGFDKGKVIR